MRLLGDLGHLLRGARYRRLLTVRVTSQAADGIFQVSLASYLLFSPEHQPDAARIALLLAALLLPFSLLGPFVGVFLDRWSRRQVLVYANLVRVAPVLGVAFAISADARDTELFGLVLASISINRFLLSALSAALPHVVEPGELVMANSITPTSGTIAFITGIGAASVIRPFIGGVDPDVGIAILAACVYGLASLLASGIPRRQLGPDFDPRLPQVRAAVRHVVAGLLAGLRHLRQRREAADALLVIAGHRFCYGLATVSTVLLYRNYFNSADEAGHAMSGLSVAVLVSGAGFLLAAVVTPVVTRRLTPQGWMLVLLVAAAAAQAFPGGLYTVPALLPAALVLGLSAQGVKICVDTLVQVHVDDAYRGRVFSLYDMTFNVVFVLAAVAGIVLIPDDGKSYGLLGLIVSGYLVTALLYGRTVSDRLVRR